MTSSSKRAAGEALHQRVQQGLGLAVDPVEILEDEQQRRLLALPEHQAV